MQRRRAARPGQDKISPPCPAPAPAHRSNTSLLFRPCPPPPPKEELPRTRDAQTGGGTTSTNIKNPRQWPVECQHRAKTQQTSRSPSGCHHSEDHNGARAAPGEGWYNSCSKHWGPMRHRTPRISPPRQPPHPRGTKNRGPCTATNQSKRQHGCPAVHLTHAASADCTAPTDNPRQPMTRHRREGRHKR